MHISVSGFCQKKAVYVIPAGDFFFKITIDYLDSEENPAIRHVDDIRGEIYDRQTREKKITKKINYFSPLLKKDFPDELFFVKDVNFDGRPDLAVKRAESNSGMKYYTFLVYEAEKNSFFEDSILSKFSEPYFDFEKEEISTFSANAVGSWERKRIYKYENKKPVLVREQIKTDYREYWDETITKRIGGQVITKTVRHKRKPKE